MAYGRSYMPVLLDQEGLFTRKSSSNILSDPRILEHLRTVAQEARNEEDDGDLSDKSESEQQKRDLTERVITFNKRNQNGAFRITQNELDYEGAVRFYFESGKEELTKAVHITNKTDVKELLPILIDKFHLIELPHQCILYVVIETDEIALDSSDCPLQIAINALKTPRFVLRVKNEEREVDGEFLPRGSPNLSSASLRTDRSSVSQGPILEVPTNFHNRTNEQTKESADLNSLDQQTTERPRVLKKARRAKSFHQLASMVRKKKGTDNAESTELSTYRLAPGILKVYGDHVSPGSNYKSVRASTISTAKEVVIQALEKYGIEEANPNNFVLCDVVGHFKVDNARKGSHEEAHWVTEYVRIVNDNEKPLVVQSLWKPAAGRLRRFELMKRVQIEAGCFFINTAENLRSSSSFSDPHFDSERSSIISDQTGNESVLSENHTGIEKSNSYATSDQCLNVTQNTPYLLLIKGYNTVSDQLFYALRKRRITVGKQQKEDSYKKPDIGLYAPDISPIHCYIHKKVSQERGAHETNLDAVSLSVFIEPVNGSHIDINGVKVEHSTLLTPGQLISLGSEYCFLFKDPTQVEEKSLRLTWLDSLKLSNTESTKRPDLASESTLTEVDGRPIEDKDSSKLTAVDSEVGDLSTNAINRSPVMLAYEYEVEDKLLDKVVKTLELKSFQLTPAYLLTMMIEHSCASFSEIYARKLLLKISSALQSIAWEKTKDIGKHASERKSNINEFFDEMMLDLAPVVTWMANSLEMLHYLQCNLNALMQNFPSHQASVRDSLVAADEELLTVLEEVIMFTFQQTVYHLTKVLYSSLPAILDANPFQSEDGDEDEEAMSTPPGVSFVIEIFRKMLNLVQASMVHPQIVTQLFEYLFFFTNASLFNSLMERGAGGKFYRWTKGVQIRGNLDVLEEFANRNGLQDQFSGHMKKIVDAVALLSIPKAQLMSMDWFSIREDFPDLNASQVQQLLGEYQLSGKSRPRGWYPPPEEVEAALRTSDVLESFATHPPLLLPTTDFQLDLKIPPEDDEFVKCLRGLCQSFGGEVSALLRMPDGKEIAIGITPSTRRSNAPMVSKNAPAIPEPQTSTPVPMKKPNTRDVTTNGDGANVKSNEPKMRNVMPVLDKELQAVIENNNNTTDMKTMESNSMSKSSVVITESRTKQANEIYRADHDEFDDDISDVDFTSNEVDFTTGDHPDDVILVDLIRGEKGLGLGLIDGLITPLASPGIYIRTIVANSPASKDGRIKLGDRILSVNGNSLIGCDYSSAMDMIINAGRELSFLIAKTDKLTIEKILSSQC